MWRGKGARARLCKGSLLDRDHLSAGEPPQIRRSEAEDGVGRPRRRPDLVKLVEVLVNEYAHRAGMADRRDAANRKAGGGAYELRVGAADLVADCGLQLLLVDPVDAARDHQHRLVGVPGAEDHRLGDLRHRAADRRRGVGGGAGRGVELLDLGFEAEARQGLAHAGNAALRLRTDGHYLPCAIWRPRSVAAAMALVISCCNPSGAIRTASASMVVPFGLITASRSLVAGSFDWCANSPEPVTVSRASCMARSAGRPAARAASARHSISRNT